MIGRKGVIKEVAEESMRYLYVNMKYRSDHQSNSLKKLIIRPKNKILFLIASPKMWYVERKKIIFSS